MRNILLLSVGLSVATFVACSSSSTSGFGNNPDGGGNPPPDGGPGQDVGPVGDAPSLGDGQNPSDALPDGAVTVTTTIYANTDDTLYKMDPMTKMVTMIGPFMGVGDASSTDRSVTDLAVDSNNDVYVNTESVVYKATVPMTPGPGVLGMGETLVGGDGNGELWSIDTTNGMTKDLGNFGNDPNNAGNIFALSGDVVFYLDAMNSPTGLATIRSCPPAGGGACIKTNDYLAGIDMTALAANYANGPTKSLLKGIYGGTMTDPVGPGTMFGDLFGLGAWQGDVYAFERHSGTVPAQLILIDTGTGAGSVVPGQSFTFTNGWSGAGVSTKVTINVPPPPPPPK
jgi:hypothetical protein